MHLFFGERKIQYLDPLSLSRSNSDTSWKPLALVSKSKSHSCKLFPIPIQKLFCHCCFRDFVRKEICKVARNPVCIRFLPIPHKNTIWNWLVLLLFSFGSIITISSSFPTVSFHQPWWMQYKHYLHSRLLALSFLLWSLKLVTSWWLQWKQMYQNNEHQVWK